MFLKPYATQRNGLCLDTSVSQATYVPKKHCQNKINIYVIKLEWYTLWILLAVCNMDSQRRNQRQTSQKARKSEKEIIGSHVWGHCENIGRWDVSKRCIQGNVEFGD